VGQTIGSFVPESGLPCDRFFAKRLLDEGHGGAGINQRLV
jgi:hypothetical protein